MSDFYPRMLFVVVVVVVLVVVLADTLIKILHYCPISPFFQHIAPLHAPLPSNLPRQSCPAAMPGSHARQPCPAAMPGSHARQPCPAAMPGSHARQPCPAAMQKYYKFNNRFLRP
jgi:hypothetical protein